MSRDSYASQRESVSARDSQRNFSVRDSVTQPRPKSSVSGAPAGATGGSGAFRKVDVDSYDENRFQEENTDDSASALNESEIGALINQGKAVDAFKRLIDEVPASGSKNANARERAVQLAVKAFASVRQPSAMDTAIRQLCDGAPAGEASGPSPQIDVLLKYVYRAMEAVSLYGAAGSDKSSDVLSTLLLWHERLVAVGGTGAIVRVLTDRRRL